MRILFLVLLATSACGSVVHQGATSKASDGAAGSTAPTKASDYSVALSDESQLPSCDSAHDKELVYITSTQKFETCQSGNWTVINVAGSAGAAGPAGAAGAAGPAGATGAAGPAGATGQAGTSKFTASIHCQGTLAQSTATSAGLSIPAGGLPIVYNAAVMTNGDVFAQSSIASAVIQVSGSAFYASSQNGAATGSVIMTDDWAGGVNYGWWNVSLNRSSGIVTAVYNDGDLGGSGTATFTFPSSGCSINNY